MKPRHSAAKVLGSLLIVVGILLVIIQMALQMRSSPLSPSNANLPASQHFVVQPSTVAVTTAYPGIEMIFVGALLLALGEYLDRAN